MENYLVARIRAVSRRRLIAWASVLCVVALAAAANARYFRNVAHGPRQVAENELSRIADPEREPDYYVRVTGTRAVDTGMQHVTVSKQNGREVSRKVDASFVGLRVGDKYLLVKRAEANDTVVAEGALVPMPSDVSSHLFAGKDAKLRDVFYPFMLDTLSIGGPNAGGYIIGGIAALLAVILGGAAWLRLRNPESHPLMARVRGWGDPMSMAAEIEQESRAGTLFRSDKRSFTANFLIRDGFFSFDVRRLADLLWGYKKVTKHSVNFIPTGKSYETVLQFPDGAVTLRDTEAHVNGALAHLAQAVPWAVIGYSDQLAATFRKDRAGFAAAIAERRKMGAGRT